MEHLQHFGLSQDPFQNEPDLRFYYDSSSHRDVQRRVERGLRQSKGLSVLTGEGGTGKTLMARRLLDGLEEEIFEANLMVMLPGAADSAVVTKRFARQLGLEEPSDDRSTLVGQVYEELCVIREDGRHAILIVDDAHLLSREALAEIGGLLNLEYEDRRLLSMLLVGLPEVDVALARDVSLGQRVDVRTRLQPLDLDNASAYISHRISVVGGVADLVSPGAMGVLFKFSRGRPRLLNTLADNALFEAYLGQRRRIEAGDVERAAGDLGIGPDPGTTYTQLPGTDPQHFAGAEAAEANIPDLEPTGSTNELVSQLAGAGSGAVAPPPVPMADAFGAEGSAGGIDLGELLDDSTVAPSDSFASFLAESPDGGTGDLDSEVEAVLSEAADDSAEAMLLGEELPLFGVGNPADAGATRIALPDEGPPKTEDDDALDEMFVELLDE